jgi:hypothetical protein
MDYWNAQSMKISRKCRASDYKIVIDNIRQFSAKSSGCSIGVSFIVTKENCSHIFDLCSLMKDIGASHVKPSPCVVSTNSSSNRTYHSSFSVVTHEEIERCTSLNDASFSVVNHYREVNTEFSKDYRSCPFLQFLTVIGAD